MRPFNKGDYRDNHPFGLGSTSLIVQKMFKYYKSLITVGIHIKKIGKIALILISNEN